MKIMINPKPPNFPKPQLKAASTSGATEEDLKLEMLS